MELFLIFSLQYIPALLLCVEPLSAEHCLYNDWNLLFFNFFQFAPLLRGITYSTCHFCRGHLKVEIKVHVSWFWCADVTDLVYISSYLIGRQLLWWWTILTEGNTVRQIGMKKKWINLDSRVGLRRYYHYGYYQNVSEDSGHSYKR